MGDVLKDAKVASMLGWGAFIEVGNGHRGLLHVDEMKWPEGAMAPSAYDCVKEDQVLEVSMVAWHLLNVFTLCHVYSMFETACDVSVSTGHKCSVCIAACLECGLVVLSKLHAFGQKSLSYTWLESIITRQLAWKPLSIFGLHKPACYAELVAVQNEKKSPC